MESSIGGSAPGNILSISTMKGSQAGYGTEWFGAASLTESRPAAPVVTAPGNVTADCFSFEQVSSFA